MYGRLTYASSKFYDLILALDVFYGCRINLHNVLLYGVDAVNSVRVLACADESIKAAFDATCTPKVYESEEFKAYLMHTITNYFTQVSGKDYSKRMCGTYKMDTVIRTALKAQAQHK